VTRHVGILGGGNISATHARAAAQIAGVQVSAVCGVNAERVQSLADTYGAAAYTDLDAFLRHRPLDIVAIGSPSGRHGEQVEAAVAHGLHVLVEKPLEISTARIDRLVEAVARAGVTLGVFFQDRANPDFVALHDEIARGTLGRPTLADARVKWYRPPEYYSQSRWRGTWALDGGGAVMNQGIHTVDLLVWLLGDVRRVHARTLTALHQIDVEDTAVALFEFTSGAVATFEATTAAWPGYNRRVAITGTKGTVLIDGDRIVARDLIGSVRAAEPDVVATGASAASPVVADQSGHRRVFEDFLRALDSGGVPGASGAEGRRSVAVIEALYESSRRGQPVDV
jgi:UDP-N-acetyl-2-amino-2-deoxyglucuronate dehydrogenase